LAFAKKPAGKRGREIEIKKRYYTGFMTAPDNFDLLMPVFELNIRSTQFEG
jgi:hypothetical protein